MISNANKKPIKILYIFGRMIRGGAETRTVELLRYIDRERYLPQFLSLSGLPGTLDDEIRKLGSDVHLCKLGRGFSRRFITLLKKEEIDIVHSNVHFTSGYILRLAEKAGVRGRIAHFRNTSDGRAATPRRIVQRAILRLLVNRHATHILSVGFGTMATLFGQNWREDPRRHVIQNGLDLSRFSEPPDRRGVRREFELPDDCPLVVHVGNFRAQKNLPFLIDIFSEIKKLLPPSRLLLVGQGENDTEALIRKQIIGLNLDRSVVFSGSRSDVPRLLSAADLMIFPSKWEGLPGAVLEASAAGIPVMGSDIPGIAELIPHLPQVQCLGLDCGADKWAKTARDFLSAGYESSHGNAIREHFAASPFSAQKCASATCSVWQQAAENID